MYRVHDRLIRLCAVVSILALCAAVPASAQSSGSRGTLTGTVLDPVGKPAGKVTVQAQSADGQTTQRATTETTGRYVIGGLPFGVYNVTVTVPGLKAFERKGVSVQAASTSLDIRLEEGSQLSTLGEDPLGIAADRARRAPPSGPTPRTADGKPDFSGVWWAPTVVDPGKPEWLPDAQQVAARRQANNRKDSPQVRCLPSAVLRRGPLVQFVQSKEVLIEITDDDSPGFHQIYLARSHPKEQDPLWYGDSVARWDGDTLVVDRNNFLDEVWLDQDAHPHSDKLHVIERYRRRDLGHMDVEITVDDPGVLARPWTFTRASELAPKEEIREFICNENNSDLPHLIDK
ncbi:MAG TPA: carboxypeptidase-like regulatory domain-containing protein [Vicinamibacterales bacterium]|nr:carboxypeptidase-like regulatory domain-containing protein [Vicinamibacterales bacterium]